MDWLEAKEGVVEARLQHVDGQALARPGGQAGEQGLDPLPVVDEIKRTTVQGETRRLPTTQAPRRVLIQT